ncbi:hypothetical protein TNIN_105771 [Trichonephila inaurata madagascariensis]|uniref:Uncharacterized protein n=1 Tax=Trichonephila inaurata madagascariensis TaxID=2747483 RepID=A0A8X6XW92_9ARAC|nr:hypothetical protein TNIN_105771 [Trichonephila inaurata madagascariensis]
MPFEPKIYRKTFLSQRTSERPVIQVTIGMMEQVSRSSKPHSTDITTMRITMKFVSGTSKPHSTDFTTMRMVRNVIGD